MSADLEEATSLMERTILEIAAIAKTFPLERRKAAAKVLRRLAAGTDGSPRASAFQAAAERLEA